MKTALAAALTVAVFLGGATLWYAKQEPPSAQPGEDCITDAELMANVATGFFIAQGIQAERCDRYLEAVGRPEVADQAEIHSEIRQKFQSKIEALDAAAADYFPRRYGLEGEVRRQRGTARTRERYMAEIRADALTCSRFADELAIRLASNWSYIEAKLRHGMQVARSNQLGLNRCRE